MNRLQGKHVVITGASGGLGKEIAIQTAKQGASVILLARSMDKLEAVRQMLIETYQIRCVCFSTRCSQSYQCKRCLYTNCSCSW